MVSESGVSLFAPIVFLVVVELASVTRSIDLEEISKDNRPPVEFRGICVFPNLGRFAFVHFGNMVLLALTAFVSLHFVDGVAGGGLLAATAILLYFLPFLEVDEYDSLLSGGGIPSSYRTHLWGVSKILGGSIPGVLVIVGFHEWGLGEIGAIYLLLIFTVAPFFTARNFTRTLRDDLSGK